MKQQRGFLPGNTHSKGKKFEFVSVVLLVLTFSRLYANPALTPGTWVNISPPVSLQSGTYGFIDIKFDPQNRSSLFATLDQKGLWHSVDGGSTWTRIGQATIADGDSPQQIQIDPNNGLHLYVVNGVRGPHFGFFVSTDGGNIWTMPSGFTATCSASPVSTTDCYTVAADPTDFNHVLVSFHSPWSGTGAYNCGVVESKDGGDTWKVIMPPNGAAGPGFAIVFLIDTDPVHKQGDSNTWMLATQSSGLYRTTDGGQTWSLVCGQAMTHGAFDPHYISNGYLYVGLTAYPTLGMNLARSTDNGVTWTAIGNNTAFGEYTYYHSIIGDGYRLYTKPGVGACAPYITSLETDGLTWTKFNNQDFSPVASADGCGPTHQIFDSVNRIIYSADWGAGIWALKVLNPPSSVRVSSQSSVRGSTQRTPRVMAPALARTNVQGARVLCDIRGKTVTGSTLSQQELVIRAQ